MKTQFDNEQYMVVILGISIVSSDGCEIYLRNRLLQPSVYIYNIITINTSGLGSSKEETETYELLLLWFLQALFSETIVLKSLGSKSVFWI